MRSVLMAALVSALIGLVPSPAAAGDRPIVEVLDAGAEPRTALRLDVAEGDEVALTFEVRQRIEQEVDGDPQPLDPIPAIRQDVSATIEEVTRRGRITYTFEVGKVEVVDDAAFDQDFLDDLDEQLEPLSDLEGEVTINRRGVLLDSELDVPDDAPAIVEDLLSEFSQQLSNLTIPYPREPVGIGARWTASTTLSAGGIDTELVYEYDLREIRSGDVLVGISYAQTARPQKVDQAGLPEGGEVRLVEYLIEGSGTSTGGLTTALPVEATVSAAGVQLFALELDGEERELRQSVSIEQTVTSRP